MYTGIRSLLYTPADNPEMMEKAVGYDADACLFDLEDAIPKNRQEASRTNIREIMESVDFSDKRVFVRIENLESDYWLRDLETAIDAGVEGISVPMVESATEVDRLDNIMRQLTDEPPLVRLAMESPLGIFNGVDIAKVCSDLDHMRFLSYGTADYSREIGAPIISDRMKEFLSFLTISYAGIGRMEAHASGTLDVDDLERLRSVLEQQRKIGFTGATCIHPKQVSVINDVFTPDKAEYEKAKRLVDAYDDYNGDSIIVEDVFLDTATVDRYRNVIERYEQSDGG